MLMFRVATALRVLDQPKLNHQSAAIRFSKDRFGDRQALMRTACKVIGVMIVLSAPLPTLALLPLQEVAVLEEDVAKPLVLGERARIGSKRAEFPVRELSDKDRFTCEALWHSLADALEILMREMILHTAMDGHECQHR